MITLDTADITYLHRRLTTRFKLDDGRVQGLIDDIQAALQGDEERLFYKVRYYVHFHNDIAFSNQIFFCAFNVYTYLSEKPENRDVKRSLEHLFYRFFKNIYTHKCNEAYKIEKRSETVQSVLQHMTTQLNGMLETQKLMIANISHEMRTSLNAISGYLTLIHERQVLSGDEKAYLEKADSAATTLKALVSDVLDISKLSSGEMELKEMLFWLDETILHSIDNVIMTANDKNLRFTTEVSLFPNRFIGDSQRIMEILTNLLSNAIKFTDVGFVRLLVEPIKETEETMEILFRVEDSGVGLSRSEMHKIFEPYTRFERDRHGVGLGLYISHKLARKMGGDLVVRSVKGKGSVFDFTVRLKREQRTAIRMQDRIICLFNDVQSETTGPKTRLLEQFGAEIIFFNDETEFSNYLFNVTDRIPDIVSVTTQPEAYARHDALIHYLKSVKKFNRTWFIAEQTGSQLPLHYFDQAFERFSTVSAYISAIETLNEKRNETTSASQKTLRLLAVDDIETNLEILSLFISNRFPGAVIDLASGGYEAIGMYKTGTYDIIFLDLKMPGLNGFNVLEKFRAIKTTPPVYALTADVYKDTFDKVMVAGFDGMLEKPLQPDILFETIEKVMHADEA